MIPVVQPGLIRQQQKHQIYLQMCENRFKSFQISGRKKPLHLSPPKHIIHHDDI